MKMILSQFPSDNAVELARATHNTPNWFQLSKPPTVVGITLNLAMSKMLGEGIWYVEVENFGGKQAALDMQKWDWINYDENGFPYV